MYLLPQRERERVENGLCKIISSATVRKKQENVRGFPHKCDSCPGGYSGYRGCKHDVTVLSQTALPHLLGTWMTSWMKSEVGTVFASARLGVFTSAMFAICDQRHHSPLWV